MKQLNYKMVNDVLRKENERLIILVEQVKEEPDFNSQLEYKKLLAKKQELDKIHSLISAEMIK